MRSSSESPCEVYYLYDEKLQFHSRLWCTFSGFHSPVQKKLSTGGACCQTAVWWRCIAFFREANRKKKKELRVVCLEGGEVETISVWKHGQKQQNRWTDWVIIEADKIQKYQSTYFSISQHAQKSVDSKEEEEKKSAKLFSSSMSGKQWNKRFH